MIVAGVVSKSNVMLLFKKTLILILLISICETAYAQNKSRTNPKASLDSTTRVSVFTDSITSSILRENKVALNNRRSIEIVLPPSYSVSKKRYPVVYYLHSIYGKAEWILGSGAAKLMERSFAKGMSDEFILVIPDCSSAHLGSLYENSTVSGRWLDFITKELVPFIDRKYRTIPHRDSRGVQETLWEDVAL